MCYAQLVVVFERLYANGRVESALSTEYLSLDARSKTDPILLLYYSLVLHDTGLKYVLIQQPYSFASTCSCNGVLVSSPAPHDVWIKPSCGCGDETNWMVLCIPYSRPAVSNICVHACTCM